MTDLAIVGAYVRVEYGRWIVDCPCASAMAVEVGAADVRCWDCGEVIGPIVWPPDPPAIAVILGYRPHRVNRNWLPGETLADLLMENIAHHVEPPHLAELAAANGGQLSLMETAGEVVIGGILLVALPAGSARPQIGS